MEDGIDPIRQMAEAVGELLCVADVPISHTNSPRTKAITMVIQIIVFNIVIIFLLE